MNKEELPIDILKEDLVILVRKYAQEDLLDFQLWPIENVVTEASKNVMQTSKEIIAIINRMKTDKDIITFINRMIILFEEYPYRQEELTGLIFSYEFRVEWQ